MFWYDNLNNSSMLFSILIGILAGIIKAVNHVIAERTIFKNSRISHWKEKFWLKSVSWRNKYNRPKIFQTMLVWTTDGWHLTNMLYMWLIVIGVLLGGSVINTLIFVTLLLLSGHYMYDYLTRKI